MAVVGYARVSTIGQSLDVQREKLEGCQKVFEEKVTGLSSTRRELNACLNYLREGDTLVVTKLDRLARSTLHLCQIAEELERKSVNLKVLDQNIDTSNPTGRLLFNMLGAIAQFETEIRSERQMEGIRKAQQKGISFGRKRSLTQSQVEELKRLRLQGVTIKALQEKYCVSKATVYRYLKEKCVE